MFITLQGVLQEPWQALENVVVLYNGMDNDRLPHLVQYKL